MSQCKLFTQRMKRMQPVVCPHAEEYMSSSRPTLTSYHIGGGACEEMHLDDWLYLCWARPTCNAIESSGASLFRAHNRPQSVQHRHLEQISPFTFTIAKCLIHVSLSYGPTLNHWLGGAYKQRMRRRSIKSPRLGDAVAVKLPSIPRLPRSVTHDILKIRLRLGFSRSQFPACTYTRFLDSQRKPSGDTRVDLDLDLIRRYAAPHADGCFVRGIGGSTYARSPGDLANHDEHHWT